MTSRRKTAEKFAEDYVLDKGNNSYGWLGSSTGLKGVNDGLSPVFV